MGSFYATPSIDTYTGTRTARQQQQHGQPQVDCPQGPFPRASFPTQSQPISTLPQHDCFKDSKPTRSPSFFHTSVSAPQALRAMTSPVQEKAPSKLSDLLKDAVFDVEKAVKTASFAFSVYGAPNINTWYYVQGGTRLGLPQVRQGREERGESGVRCLYCCTTLPIN